MNTPRRPPAPDQWTPYKGDESALTRETREDWEGPLPLSLSHCVAVLLVMVPAALALIYYTWKAFILWVAA
jgi:hypothetical protein